MESPGLCALRDMHNACRLVLRYTHRTLAGDSAYDFIQLSASPLPGKNAVLVVVSEGVDDIDRLLAIFFPPWITFKRRAVISKAFKTGRIVPATKRGVGTFCTGSTSIGWGKRRIRGG
jgi:hypothetical protein